MAEQKPSNKAAEPAENKATEAENKATEAEKATVYHLTTPDGRKYNTPDKAEAEHLTRTRGYKLTK